MDSASSGNESPRSDSSSSSLASENGTHSDGESDSQVAESEPEHAAHAEPKHASVPEGFTLD